MYRNQHSTETALLELLNSVYVAANDKQVAVLVGLDLCLWPQHTAPTPADRVWNDKNGAVVALVLP